MVNKDNFILQRITASLIRLLFFLQFFYLFNSKFRKNLSIITADNNELSFEFDVYDELNKSLKNLLKKTIFKVEYL